MFEAVRIGEISRLGQREMALSARTDRMPWIAASGCIVMLRYAAVLVLVATAQLQAQGVIPPGPSTLDEAMDDLRRDIAIALRDETQSSLLSRPLDAFERLAGSDQVLSPEDMELERHRIWASARASQIGLYLSWDLDGDGDVSMEEARAITVPNNNPLRTITSLDQNGDGVATFQEMIDDAVQRQRATVGPSLDPARFLIFDVDGDGSVTLQEIDETLDRIAAEAPAPAPTPTECDAPRPREEARLFLLHGQSGRTLTNVHFEPLADDHRTMTISRLHIEAGDRPLYVFVFSYGSRIWQITGATERIERLVLQSGAATGVIGLDAQQVHFIDGHACFRGSIGHTAIDRLITDRQTETYFGRTPDHIIRYGRTGAWQLPSGSPGPQHRMTAQEFTLGGWRYEITPEGIRALEGPDGLSPPSSHPVPVRSSRPEHTLEIIDPADVLSPHEVTELEVLPGAFGYAQLLADGRLRRDEDRTFRITAPIPHFPVGDHLMSGTYLLETGVPLPENLRGHAVFSEETGACLSPRCF